MPRILVDDKVAQRLRIAVGVAAEGGRESGGSSSQGEHVLSHLQHELDIPPSPPAYAGKGATYPEGTVVSHERLLEVAAWAGQLASGAAAAAIKQERGVSSATVRGHDPQRQECVQRLAGENIDLESLSLDQLLKGAQVAIATRPKPARSPELIESLRKIELAQQEAEYNAMLASSVPLTAGDQGSMQRRRGFARSGILAGTNPTARDRASEAEEWKEVRRQLGAIANVGLSMAAVVTAVWWAGGTADPIWKTLVAMPIAILVAIAEIVLYTRHWSNLQKRGTVGSSGTNMPRRITR